ncbi:ABC transporter related protein [Emticicia oligotrophica DSM 17448]|jgi:ABC-type multidrug transport system ATPase subunit|uniref:ABC transporter related protein n=1 Tax=Emticicia oligotrophica (strain DSM 17448 / CIP 109782 / MTCC 6937 / GPTSA100-15) TaxID=929562 RepID=A0ABN4ARJ8_EMTOG|nr:ABC transporter ATP-binding protein [Emticicia oligotrophica]AFK04107.1 ABC transporter related protein [Emticicia oligotrophica DSM 17448]
MTIELENLGKKFRKEWIFRNVNLRFDTGKSYTFVGPNGSGKSTLLQVLIGVMPHSEGKVSYTLNGVEVSLDDIYKKIVIAAPYLELVEEFTLLESIEFHQKFKPFKDNITSHQLLDYLQLTPHKDKAIKNFSSGMKQRLKLGLAFYSEAPIILLDEPTSNLDAQGSAWYLEQIEKHTENRLLIICSNQPNEYTFCNNIVDIRDYK